MLPPSVSEAIRFLNDRLGTTPHGFAALFAHWRRLDRRRASASLSADVVAQADVLDRALPALTRSSNGTADLARLLSEPGGELIFGWCGAASGRADARIAPVLAAAANVPAFRDRVAKAARDRVLEGPLLDALACVPTTGGAEWLLDGTHPQVRARMDILLWEAGASALQMPELGTWVFGNEDAFKALIVHPAHETLRGRVLAARALEVCAKGLSPDADPQRVGEALQMLQPLLLHPEPLVWVHAARALGRLAGVIDALEGTLLDWMRSESAILRQRAVTAFASMPADKLRVLAGEIVQILDDPQQEAWVLAAAAAATPYLFFERRDLWDRLCARITAGDGGAVSARALAKGLGALWRRGVRNAAVETPLRELRETARRYISDSLDDWRRWLEVIAATDPVDGAERDPLDVEQGLENLVRLAAQYDDEEADARAARFANTLSPTFQEARRIALTEERPRRRAAGLNAVEGTARSLALGLWGPLLVTRPAGSPIPEPDLSETWSVIMSAPEALLDEVAEWKSRSTVEPDVALAIEILALRLGGYALDACGEEPTLGAGRGATAHAICLWLRKLEGLADGSRDLPAPLRGALSALFWRLVDTTRGTALGEVDDVRWLGPFAAWWALVIDRPAMLQQLASALPMINTGALELCTAQADAIRAAVSTDDPRAAEGSWLSGVEQPLIDLHADETELSHALLGLARTLATFAQTSGQKPDLEPQCSQLAFAAERLSVALADPVGALHDSPGNEFESENAPRIAALVARAIRARDLSSLAVWFSSLGPVTSGLVERAVTAAVRRTPPPPPAPKKQVPQTIEGYELVKPLGEGGIGSVWLVRKPGADRLFVLKIPKADALQNANDAEREGILKSFVEEARALAGLYHPNVANIIDRGVSQGMPFLVLEYLIGADLKQYASARPFSLMELRSVVVESCAGLHSFHNAGLVHRDIKPANLWLRLPLQGGERFDPAKHRDPARTPPLSTVVIDFGMVRAMKVTQEAMGKFVAGTPGYIAPEQVLDPMELDGRADIYALAGTIYNVTTGRTFFDDISSQRDRIIAHMQREPLEDNARVASYPSGLVKLMRAATQKSWADRPTALEFGREFAALL